MNNTYPFAIQLLLDKKVNLKSLISYQVPLQSYLEAFETASHRKGNKVFINLA